MTSCFSRFEPQMDVADLGDLRAKLDVVNGEKRAVGLTSSSDGASVVPEVVK